MAWVPLELGDRGGSLSVKTGDRAADMHGTCALVGGYPRHPWPPGYVLYTHRGTVYRAVRAFGVSSHLALAPTRPGT